MNDEINKEVAGHTMTLVFRAARLTGDTLQRAVNAYLSGRQSRSYKEPKHGQMTYKQLMKQGQGAVAIEVEDNKIRTFAKVAKKYGVDFAFRKDKSYDPPKYMVFFKGRDQDSISMAFREFVKVNEKNRGRVSVRNRLKSFIHDLSQNKNRERFRNRNRNLDIGL